MTAKVVSRAFDEALAAAGGFRPVGLILISLKMERLRSQRELARAVGIEGATLTHHVAAGAPAALVFALLSSPREVVGAFYARSESTSA
jgi:MarR family transcriptional regulator for hemolysin